MLCFLFIIKEYLVFFFFFSSRRRHTRWTGDWSSDVCSSDLGKWELEALEVEESAGLAATNGHQIAENPAARTLFSARVRFGSIDAVGANGRVLRPISIAGWRAVGAADHARPAGDGRSLRFRTSGAAGVLRPTQPS